MTVSSWPVVGWVINENSALGDEDAFAVRTTRL